MCAGPEILFAAGTGMQVLGGLQQGNAAKGAADYNATLGKANAEITRKQALEDERRFRVGSRQRLGSARASIGASGVTLDGSALETLEQNARMMEEDAITIRTTGNMKALGYQADAKLQSFYGDQAQKASYYGAAAALLGGATDIGAYRAMKRT